MCGIFGLVVSEHREVPQRQLRIMIERLFELSQSRGKEASGMVLRTPEAIRVYKEPLAASALIRQPRFRSMLNSLGTDIVRGPIAMLGHSRLVTNGIQTVPENNQPVMRDGLVTVHNGIITNDDDLWKRHSNLQRVAQVDTEIFLALLAQHARGNGSDFKCSVRQVFSELEGTASVAVLGEDLPCCTLATNNGSLYLGRWDDTGVVCFASERLFLQDLETHLRRRSRLFSNLQIEPIPARNGVSIDISTAESIPFQIGDGKPALPPSIVVRAARVVERSVDSEEAPDGMKRCTRCVLPHTMPFIEFDSEGVCNYCHTYQPVHIEGGEALERAIAPYRRNDGRPDCIVMFSGGRDSAYGLHYIKNELKMNPVAYTYDWGMITDLGRRNQARMCGSLGVEHLVVSADIARKRRYIRSNIEAWLRRPDLGMVPLFMAGDKQYYYHANKLMNKLGIRLAFACECPLELSRFKAGFCGIREGSRRIFDVSVAEKLRLLGYYGRQYLSNPRYLNGSLLDTFLAFLSAYFMNHDYVFPFRYVPWHEETIVDTLVNGYHWELAEDTNTTWRIGDGTAAFYNYIYHTVAGFTENDSLRSNQIREGHLTREHALRLVHQENQPRWESLQWYASTIGFDLDHALSVINAMPKRFAP